MKWLLAMGLVCVMGGAVMGQTLPQTQAEMDARARSVEAQRAKEDAQQRLDAQLQDLESQRARLRAELRDQTGWSDEKGMLDAIRRMEDEHERAALAMEMKKVRSAAVAQKIQDLSNEAVKKAGSDEITANLEMIASLRQQEAQRAQEQVKAGIAPTADAEKLRTEVLEAQVRVLQRKEEIQRGMYGDLLAALNKELISVSLDLIEQEQLESALRKRLDTLRKSDSLIFQLRRLEDQNARVRAENGLPQRDKGELK